HSFPTRRSSDLDVSQRIDVSIGHHEALGLEGSIPEKRRTAVAIKIAPELVFDNRFRVTETGVLANDQSRGEHPSKGCGYSDCFFHKTFIPHSILLMPWPIRRSIGGKMNISAKL